MTLFDPLTLRVGGRGHVAGGIFSDYDTQTGGFTPTQFLPDVRPEWMKSGEGSRSEREAVSRCYS